MTSKVCIFWFRRDLRLEDNAALYHALKSGIPVQPIFIFDRNILDLLQNKKDSRVQFIHQELTRLQAELKALGANLRTYFDTPENAWKKIIEEFEVSDVYANRDYEPYARKRDQKIFEWLKTHNIVFHGKKDHVIFEKGEVTKDDGKPYTVFTPYSKKWKSKLSAFYLKAYPTQKYFSGFLAAPMQKIHSLKDIGFEVVENVIYPDKTIKMDIIKKYESTRDIPSIDGTSRLSLHLRFGTLSIRALCTVAEKTNEKWLNELIWRDFYQMILYHFPHTETHSFKPMYDKIVWLNNEVQYKQWCEGMTGYPLVDAGMRELNATGHMHNRVRMVVSSFLTKHLLIDWRWGEAYFAEKLLDFEKASNVGGWQWAAGCGCDAAPYFRIFNPESQMEKFDPEKKYIRKWVPEYGTSAYPKPIVDHKMARERVLSTYKRALGSE
jgi:deoxyribodipyrimidine photo-lyase